MSFASAPHRFSSKTTRNVASKDKAARNTPPTMDREDTTTTVVPPPRLGRQICEKCDRPQTVCLCHVIPADLIETQTKIVILHHPHESQHKLNTTPLLAKSLRHVTTVPGRRLLRHHLPEDHPPAIYLFPPSPTTPSVTLSDLRSQRTTPLTVIAIDATWKHAKEMVKASEGVLNEVGALRVCLDTGIDESVTGGSMYDSELLLRKEPFGGCVSTAEAVARCLGAVEPDGAEIERKLIRVLREMVRLQAGFLKPMKPRTKLLKKNKQKEKDEDDPSP